MKAKTHKKRHISRTTKASLFAFVILVLVTSGCTKKKYLQSSTEGYGDGAAVEMIDDTEFEPVVVAASTSADESPSPTHEGVPGWFAHNGVNPIVPRETAGLDGATVTRDESDSTTWQSTGTLVSADGIEWVELIDPASSTGTFWLPAPELARVGEILPIAAPGTYAPIGPDAVSLAAAPNGATLLTMEPAERMNSTGLRAEANNQEWLQVEYREDVTGWVLVENVIATAPNDTPVSLNVCLASGVQIIALTFTDTNGVNFVGELSHGAEISVLEGTRLTALNVSEPTFEVEIRPIDATSAKTEIWQAGHADLTTADGTVFGVIECDEAVALQYAGDAEIERSCFADGETVAFFDRTYDGTFTGAVAFQNTVEAFAGRITTEQRGGVSAVLDVNTSPIGSGEDGAAIVQHEEWSMLDAVGSPYALAGERVYAELVDCDDVSERIAQLDQLVDTFPALPIPM